MHCFLNWCNSSPWKILMLRTCFSSLWATYGVTKWKHSFCDEPKSTSHVKGVGMGKGLRQETQVSLLSHLYPGPCKTEHMPMHQEEKPLSGANARRQSREHESTPSGLTNCTYLTCEAAQHWLRQQVHTPNHPEFKLAVGSWCNI